MDPNVSPPFVDPNLASLLPYLAYLACSVLIILYSWDRFNTPASNRSSTRQALYWWGCAGYIVSALGLFAVLSILLVSGPWRTILLGSADAYKSLPAPFIATLAMTTLLSSVPLLKRIDGWFLSTFLDWAAIPAEVKRRAATMTLQSFRVTKEDVKALRDDGSYGDTVTEHLCARCNGMEPQYRLTKILKLYDRIKDLEGESRYTHFFSEAADEFAALERKVTIFLRRSDIPLTLAKRFRKMDGAKRFRKINGQDAQAIYDDLMQERRNTFAEDCRNLFGELALFLARAVLRSEPSEKDIVNRLCEIGFSASEPMNLPRFPIDSLTLLAGALLLYFLIVLRLPIVPDQPDGWFFTASKVTMARLASIGLTVWLMQKNYYSVFRRLPGGRPRYFGYVLCGILAASASAGVCLIFRHGGVDALGSLKADLPIIILSGVLCAALALCCDDWTEDTVAPTWLRCIETVGCGLVMGVVMVLLYFGTDLLPKISPLVLVLPPVLGVIVGGWVPHIYRSAHRAAMSDRGNAPELPVSQVVAEARITPSPVLAASPAQDYSSGSSAPSSSRQHVESVPLAIKLQVSSLPLSAFSSGCNSAASDFVRRRVARSA
jgi:hypothetical protein